MRKFQNLSQAANNLPECFSCCGTTCDNTLLVTQYKSVAKSSSTYYSWYLESQAENEKLRVEMVTLKQELKDAKKASGWHR